MAFSKAFLAAILLSHVVLFALAANPSIWSLTGGNEMGVGEGYNIRSQRRTGFSLFQYTPSSDTVYVNGVTYSVPAEIVGIGRMTIKNDSEVMVLESFSQFQDMKSKNWGVSVGLTLYGVTVGVGLNMLRGQINGLLKNNSRYFNVGSYIWHGFDLEVDWRDATLDRDFYDDIMRLPASYSPDPYRAFINAYGTHFFDKVGYGCKWNTTVAFDRSLTEKSGARWSSTQVGISVSYSLGAFGIGIGMNFSTFKNQSRIDGEFQKHATGSESLLGGDETLIIKGLDAWYPTCVKNRAILLEKSTLKPIAEIIKDAPRKAAMIQALKDFALHP